MFVSIEYQKFILPTQKTTNSTEYIIPITITIAQIETDMVYTGVLKPIPQPHSFTLKPLVCL